MGKIEVSFILGILNVERTLEECLDSILIQEYPKKEYELIVIDGGSTDKTLEIISQYRSKYDNLKLIHNPHKLSEGKGMSKDMGISQAKGEFIVLLDGDNILVGKNWLAGMLAPFKSDNSIMASQSLLSYRKGDTNFLKYVNALGVEDPFAVPNSLVAQVVLYPEKFKLHNGYYEHVLDSKDVLFGGANGCVFKKEVFKTIDGYTRDVDVFASMAEYSMKVVVPLAPRVYHKTAATLSSFMIKKGVYFYRFITYDYGWKKFRWVKKGLRGKIGFSLQLMYNISILGPLWLSLKQMVKTKRFFWLLHPLFLYFITLEYALISIWKFGNFTNYSLK